MKVVIWAGILLPALVGGCGHPGDDELTTFRADLADVRAELSSYRNLCESAPTLADVATELGRHDERMRWMLDLMTDDLDGMSPCSESGMGRMRKAMDTLRAQMAAHDAAVAAASTLDEAHARCAEHAAAMQRALDVARSSMGQMGCGMM